MVVPPSPRWTPTSWSEANGSYVTMVDENVVQPSSSAETSSSSRWKLLRSVAINCGLAIQVASFVMLRSYLQSEMCDAQVLMWSELIKLVVALAAAWTELHLLFERAHLAVIPVITYGVMNLLSFWSLKRLPATLSIAIIQLKIVFTALFARLFVGRPLLTPRSFSLVALVFGCIALTELQRAKQRSDAFGSFLVGQMHACLDRGTDGLDQQGLRSFEDEWVHWQGGAIGHSLIWAAIAALTTETLLSGLVAVYMERIFELRPAIMWRRNVQLATLSVAFYLAVALSQPAATDVGSSLSHAAATAGAATTEDASDGSASARGCPRHRYGTPDVNGAILAAVSAAGGLLIALSILYSGAVGKVVSVSGSIALTMLAESLLLYQALPDVLTSSLCALILNAVVMYAVLPG